MIDYIYTMDKKPSPRRYLTKLNPDICYTCNWRECHKCQVTFEQIPNIESNIPAGVRHFAIHTPYWVQILERTINAPGQK